MHRLSRALSVAVFALAGCSAPLPAGVPAVALGARPQSIAKIRHVVIIFQENRSVDDLFNGFPGADTARTGRNSRGATVALRPVPLTAPYDMGHTHQSFVQEYDGGRDDGWDKDGSRCFGVDYCAPQGVRAFGFVPHGEVVPYFTMAQRYAFADRMFQSNQGPSFPAHQYIVSGTSAISNGSSLRASENPFDLENNPTGGCDSPAGSLVPLIDAQGKENQYVYPCFDRISLMQLLDAKALTWRYYQSFAGPGIWHGPDAISRIVRSPEFSTDVVAPPAQVLLDVAKGDLADVTWVTPTNLASDHARVTDGSGPSWVAAVVNAIGESAYWNDTAIFVTWDDWGGWYDHVKPPVYNSYELGFRVPLIVISPYAKNHYVSHVQHEFGSILKFVERAFGLGSLHTTDQRADDLSDCFDFTKSPSKFKPIPARLSRRYFLQHSNDGSEPDDDSGYDSKYVSLYSFGANGKADDGRASYADLVANGETLYGTTRYGGASTAACPLGCGTLFAVNTSDGEHVIYRFKGNAGGASPLAGLIEAGGALYGTTSAGGSAAQCTGGCGTLYTAGTSGSGVKTLHAFGASGDGATPVGDLLAYDGAIFGTTEYGGKSRPLCARGCGTVFRIGASSGSESVLHAFGAARDGSLPIAGLIEVAGTLYGTTQYGGTRTAFCVTGCGTVFALDPRSGDERVIYRFNYTPNRADGAYPAAALVALGGALYGTTLGGGAASQGTIFEITPSSTEEVLHSFDCCKSGDDGMEPAGALILSGSTLYGTTRHGGLQRKGTIYSVTASGAERVLYDFGNRPDGAQPAAALYLLGSALYGTTAYGGSTGEGTIFTFAP
jgi:phospholipase C